MSSTDVETEEGSTMTHVVLRLSIGTFQQSISPEEAMEPENITECAKRMCPNLSVECFLPIISRRASNVIAEFDQKTSLQAKQFKVGVLFQKSHQFTEEELFRNTELTDEFETFLTGLGDTIAVKGHQGYSGGLDTKHNQTGTHSVFTEFNGFEIMFHVAQMLPFRYNYHDNNISCTTMI